MSRRHKVFRLHPRRWAATRRAVLKRDGHRCTKCGRAGRLEVDHVKPLWQGGDPWDLDNMAALCRKCHIAKTGNENRRELTPAEQAWRDLVSSTLN